MHSRGLRYYFSRFWLEICTSLMNSWQLENFTNYNFVIGTRIQSVLLLLLLLSLLMLLVSRTVGCCLLKRKTNLTIVVLSLSFSPAIFYGEDDIKLDRLRHSKRSIFFGNFQNIIEKIDVSKLINQIIEQ